MKGSLQCIINLARSLVKLIGAQTAREAEFSALPVATLPNMKLA